MKTNKLTNHGKTLRAARQSPLATITLILTAITLVMVYPMVSGIVPPWSFANYADNPQLYTRQLIVSGTLMIGSLMVITFMTAFWLLIQSRQERINQTHSI